MIRIAVAEPAGVLDPLYADGRSSRLVARQIYEPPITRQRGPFVDSSGRLGPASSLRATDRQTIWELRLRGGLRFSDGTPLDATAVKDNVYRWIDSGVAGRLLPGLVAADSPKPGLARLLFDHPVPDLPARLANGRFGLVSPASFARSGSGPFRKGGSGTGPFELREQSDSETLLARNELWWGGDRFELGPGVDRIELVTERGELDRVTALEDSDVQIADELGPLSSARLRSDPLLTSVRGREVKIGLSRSVRGLDAAGIDQSLADVWLTNLR